MESTYGSTDSSKIPPLKSESQRLATSINKTVNKGGSVLIPVFSLGKMQEMLGLISRLTSTGKIPDLNIYTGGIGTKINRIYDYNRYVVKRTETEFLLNDIPQRNLFEVDDPSEFFRNPSIVLASSGMMMPGTASFRLAGHWIKQKDSAIFIVGYMDPETPGYLFSVSQKGDKINFNGNMEIINCDILRFRFPSHARREGLIEIANKLKPENIILIHGEEESIKWVGSELIKADNKRKVFIAVTRKEIILE
jgi:predicted metal-dependent RNase